MTWASPPSEELETAARAGSLRRIRGVSAATEARILAGIEELSRRPSRRLLMGEAQAIAARMVALIETLPGVISATAAGSVRRRCETVGDLDVLVETERPADVIERLAVLPVVVPAPGAGGLRDRHDRITLRLRDGPQLDVMTMSPGVAGSYLLHLTGSAAHNVALRHRARQQGWSLSERGLQPLQGGAVHTFEREAALYARLGLGDIPLSYARDAVRSRRPRQGRCHAWCASRTCEAIATVTLTGPMAANPSRSWSSRRVQLVVNTRS